MMRFITTLSITLFFFVNSIFAQEIVGDWYGQLDIQGTKLRINFHVSESNGIYTTIMDSPDQKAFGIPTDSTSVNKNTIDVSLKSMMISFKGVLQKDKIKGTFSQGGMELSLNLSHNKIEKSKPKKRPQTPIKPYPYKSEEVVFSNKNANNIKLSGTLTIPNNITKPTVAILITGSGPQNRDSEILGHNPFLVIADYLTRNGIAVLRYDDRGIAKSEGTQIGATSKDFATDVESAIAYLKTRTDIDNTKIGLIGHSEGGFIAPMVASKNKDVAYIILLAGIGVDGEKILRSQSIKLLELSDVPKINIDYNDEVFKTIYQQIKLEKEQSKLKESITSIVNNAIEKAPNTLAKEMVKGITNQMEMITSPWMQYFVKIDPKQFLSKVNCSVLALNGSKDFQVISSLNLKAIQKALTNTDDVTIKELEGLNHLFQTCKTGNIDEYSIIEETFSPKALEVISKWIKKRF